MTAWNHVRAVLLLPFMNTVVVPSTLLILVNDSDFGSGSKLVDVIAVCASIPLLAVGLVLVVRAISLFVKQGQGSLAPWDPTRVLITEDIYLLSRNPMKAGLFLVLIGECVLLRSAALTVWALCFIGANVIYIRWFEEPGLHARFGGDYEAYCRRVPRWFRRVSLRRGAGDPVGSAS